MKIKTDNILDWIASRGGYRLPHKVSWRSQARRNIYPVAVSTTGPHQTGEPVLNTRRYDEVTSDPGFIHFMVPELIIHLYQDETCQEILARELLTMDKTFFGEDLETKMLDADLTPDQVTRHLSRRGCYMSPVDLWIKGVEVPSKNEFSELCALFGDLSRPIEVWDGDFYALDNATEREDFIETSKYCHMSIMHLSRPWGRGFMPVIKFKCGSDTVSGKFHQGITDQVYDRAVVEGIELFRSCDKSKIFPPETVEHRKLRESVEKAQKNLADALEALLTYDQTTRGKDHGGVKR